MINFYRRYIPNCAEVIAPLTELTKNRAPNNVEWGAEQEKAFKEVKKIPSSEPILKLPDLNREIILCLQRDRRLCQKLHHFDTHTDTYALLTVSHEA